MIIMFQTRLLLCMYLRVVVSLKIIRNASVKGTPCFGFFKDVLCVWSGGCPGSLYHQESPPAWPQEAYHPLLLFWSWLGYPIPWGRPGYTSRKNQVPETEYPHARDQKLGYPSVPMTRDWGTLPPPPERSKSLRLGYPSDQRQVLLVRNRDQRLGYPPERTGTIHNPRKDQGPESGVVPPCERSNWKQSPVVLRTRAVIIGDDHRCWWRNWDFRASKIFF